jgi:hypothetical protein
MLNRAARACLAALTVAGAGAALTTGVASGAAPVQGSISGPVTSVKGKTFSVKTTLSPTGSSKVTVGSKTTITEQVTVKQSDLKTGICVMAVGTKQGATVVARSITVSRPVKGKCVSGFARGPRPGGGPPNGAPPRNGGGYRPPNGSRSGFNPANFGFAVGGVSAVKGSTLTVHGQNGTTKVTVSKTTMIRKTIQVTSNAVAARLCAFVRGTSSDKGVTVQATDVSLSKPGPNGCTFGFRGPR